MVFDRSLCAAIIAIYPSFRVLKLWWHRLSFNGTLQVPKLPFHVDNASTANRAFVGAFHVFIIASMMYAVTALHEYHSLGRRKHVLAAYRAVTIS